jgi:hypothetical protein
MDLTKPYKMNTPKQPDEPTNQERAIIPIGPHGVELKDIDAMFRFAACYLQSGLAPASFKNAQQLVIAWAKAAELGLSPLQAVEGMSIISNRVGLMGDLALALVESSGLLQDKSVEYFGDGDSLTCEVMLQRKGRKPHKYSFSVHDAKVANIYERSPVWKGYPQRMTYYRALGFGLRDEFPDVLKGTKTVEELQDYPDNLAADEAKIAENRRRDAELKAAGIPGAKFVPSKQVGKKPTPAEEVEPAFKEDKFPVPPDEPPDDIDMSPPEPPGPKPPEPEETGFLAAEDRKEEIHRPAPPPPAAAEPPAPKGPKFSLELEGDFKETPPPEPGAEPPWKNWVIKSIPVNIGAGVYHNKKIGDLTPAQLKKIELQWLPAIRQDWDDANEAQKLDAPMFEAAIEDQKNNKPW